MTDAAGDVGSISGPPRAASSDDNGERALAPEPTRRRLLTAAAAAAGLLATGCQGIQALGKPPPPASDVRALERAIAAERDLVTSYAAALRQLGGSPGTATSTAGTATSSASTAGAGPGGGEAALTAIRAVHGQHVVHLAQLTRRLREPAGGAAATNPALNPAAVASPSAGASASASAAAPAAGGPGGQLRGLLSALGSQEQTASARLLGDLAVLPPSLAQLFASIAASEATHVPYLQAAGRRS